MQPIRRLLANATLRASSRGGRIRPRKNTRRQAVILCVLRFSLGCLMLLPFAGARPAAAAGICKEGRPEITVFTLHIDGHKLEIFVGLEGDKITGKMHANAAYPGETQMVGSVAGQFYPDKGMFLQIFLYPPAPAGARLLIWGRFSEGSGQGEVRQTDWGADVPNHTWIGMTAKGCAKWPEDVFRHNLAQAAEAQADTAVPALAAANPLYACDAGSWSLSSVGGLGQEFVSDCAKKIVGTLPWRDDGQLGASVTARALPTAMATGPGSMPWRACEAALNKRVSAIIETMQPTCEKGKRLQEAKNRCVPVHTTGDGRIYQNVPSPFTDEGKDVQLCMNEVQRCFDRNAAAAAQDSCASQVLGCFDTGSDIRVSAAKLFGGGGGATAIAAIAGRNVRASRANLFCLSMKSASDANAAFVPSGKHWSILAGGSSNGLAVGNQYADLAASVLRCPSRFAATSPILIRRPSLSLAFAERLDLDAPGTGLTRLVSLNSGDWCPPKIPPAATIPVRLPADGKAPPKLTNTGRGSSGSDGSFMPRTPVARTPDRGGATAVRAPQPSSGFDTSRSDPKDRLTGDGMMGGSVGSGSRLPDTSRGRQGGATATRGSSGASSAKPSSSSQSSSGYDGVQGSGTSVSPGKPQNSSGAYTVQSTGTSVPRTNKPPSFIQIYRPQQQPPSDAYRYRVN